MPQSLSPPTPFARALTALFGGGARLQEVFTTAVFDESEEAVWRRLVSYEEIDVPPPWILRTLLPQPLRTTGDKTRVFTDLHCQYRGGSLVKRMILVDPPHRLRFEVTQQHLGIEGCVRALAGSYDIQGDGLQTHVILTTHYLAKLRPRWLWHPVEQYLGHVFHRHILNGMRHVRLHPRTTPEASWLTSPSSSRH